MQSSYLHKRLSLGYCVTWVRRTTAPFWFGAVTPVAADVPLYFLFTLVTSTNSALLASELQKF